MPSCHQRLPPPRFRPAPPHLHSLDYWHYPSDILTGLALGFLTAFFVYRVTYPPLTHPRCDLPNVILVREEKEARGE